MNGELSATSNLQPPTSNMKHEYLSRLKFPLRIVATGLLLGLVGDLLFYGNPLGISAPIFTAGLLVALVGIAVVEETSIVWGNLWIAAPMVFLAAMSAVRAEPLLRFLNLSGVLLLLALQAYSLTTRPLIELKAGLLSRGVRPTAAQAVSTELGSQESSDKLLVDGTLKQLPRADRAAGAGPSLNTLITVMSLVSSLFAPIIAAFHLL